MEQNESLTDRTIRLFLGIIILFLSYFFAVGFWEILFYVIAIILIIEAFTGYCVFYKLYGISTNKKEISVNEPEKE